MKRYAVVMSGKRFMYQIPTNSWRLAKWLADLNCWTYARVNDRKIDGRMSYSGLCVYINDRRA